MQEFLLGLEAVFTVYGLLAILVGTVLGIIIGALPGLGPSLGVALLIPVTFSMSPSVSLNMLVALYLAAEYGGSISAILIGTPGTAAATATVVDGYEMNKKGEGLKALQASLIASTIGGVIGGIFLMAFSQPLVGIALRFGPAEYFSLGIVGLTMIASLAGKEMWKGLAAALIGLLLATVGVDPISGTPRFTLGQYQLYEGIPFLVVLIGVFAIGEAFQLAGMPDKTADPDAKATGAGLDRKGVIGLLATSLRGSAIGSIVGAIPGAGANIAGWFSYDQERRLCRTDPPFGEGNIRGVAAPEAANSSSVGGALVPLLSLGIPGSPTTAVLLGAFVIHGLRPGPELFESDPGLIYGIFVSLVVAYVLVLVLGLAAQPLWARILALPNSVLAPGILVLSIVGAFSIRNLAFDVWLALGFGIVGYLLKQLRFPMAPLVLAMILGAIIESNYARALIISGGDHMIFLQKPISLVLLLISAASLILPPLTSLRQRRSAERDKRP